VKDGQEGRARRTGGTDGYKELARRIARIEVKTKKVNEIIIPGRSHEIPYAHLICCSNSWNHLTHRKLWSAQCTCLYSLSSPDS
jgi:hypothetical protein